MTFSTFSVINVSLNLSNVYLPHIHWKGSPEQHLNVAPLENYITETLYRWPHQIGARYQLPKSIKGAEVPFFSLSKIWHHGVYNKRSWITAYSLAERQETTI